MLSAESSGITSPGPHGHDRGTGAQTGSVSSPGAHSLCRGWAQIQIHGIESSRTQRARAGCLGAVLRMECCMRKAIGSRRESAPMAPFLGRSLGVRG